ncbi:MAG: acyltransferase [Selenomonadaceae bacterium]|nr:acyltransferase [Selenomonadaceae bacterium]
MEFINRGIAKIQILCANKDKYIEILRNKGVVIGDKCEIYKTASFGSEPYLISIGNHVRINAGVQFVTHDGGLWVLRDSNAGYGDEFKDADKFGKIIIHDNVHIGTNSIIMPGVEIGENVIVGCGAVVTKSIPPNEIWGGIPARKIEGLDEYVEKVRKKYVNTKQFGAEEKKEWLLNNFLNNN